MPSPLATDALSRDSRQTAPLHDLGAPLGMGRRETPRVPRTWKGPAVVAMLALAVFGGSLATALREPDFQRVSHFSQPLPALPQSDPLATAMEARRDSGPTITRMNGDGGVSIVEASPFAVDQSYTGSIRVVEPGSLRQPARMAHIPDAALIEASSFGDLPRRAADGRRPLDVYAGAPGSGSGTRIALVVGGLGISQTGTQAALRALPPAVTLGFAASGNSLDRWMREARQHGHELVLQAPMEPFGYPNVSPGANTLTTEAAAAGDLSDLHRAMARMTNYVGVMNFMGARLSSEPAAMDAVLADVGRRGLLYLDDGSSPRSAARDAAMAGSVPFARAERLLDAVRDREAIRTELDILERSARAQGSAIGVASAFDTSVSAIAEWVSEAQGRGVEIVPVSALAYDPELR
ncbi:divergent polysaccharide deacetylase family protein [Aureimonas mangrovi]|uniref:divergent polysaccharide deacetylase family protein n=1 Tax=Aureimonas mangrovi TaxID=2758041 RepID=UPI001FE6E8F6|nr:divergent polysaccharide deacetylase family protein [Aureimonas mangrovi]